MSHCKTLLSLLEISFHLPVHEYVCIQYLFLYVQLLLYAFTLACTVCQILTFARVLYDSNRAHATLLMNLTYLGLSGLKCNKAKYIRKKYSPHLETKVGLKTAVGCFESGLTCSHFGTHTQIDTHTHISSYLFQSLIIRGFVFFRLVRNGDSPQKMAVENSCRNLNIVKSVGE